MNERLLKIISEKTKLILEQCLSKADPLAEDLFNCSIGCGKDNPCYTGCVDPSTGQPVNSIATYCSNFSVYTAFQWIKLKVFDVTLTTVVDVGVPLYGYVTPMLFILILMLNSLMMAILCNQKIRSPTNLILCLIAALDTLTIAFPLPWYLYFYSFEGYREFAPFTWCVWYRYFVVLFPTVCHKSSLWLTVVLSIQRYLGVSRPNTCKFISSYKAVWIGFFATLSMTAIFHSAILFLEDVQSVRVVGKELLTVDGVKYVDTCSYMAKNDKDYFTKLKTFLWVRIVFVEILPIVLLFVFNALLLRKTYNSYLYRRELITGNKLVSQSELREVIRTNTMLVSLCFFCMLVAIPTASMLFLLHLQNLHGVSIFSERSKKLSMTLMNFILFLSLPANFVICFGLSEKFRRTLKQSIFKRNGSHFESGVSTTMLSAKQLT